MCILTKPKLLRDRTDLLKRKAAFAAGGKGKGDKHTTETIQKKIDWYNNITQTFISPIYINVPVS